MQKGLVNIFLFLAFWGHTTFGYSSVAFVHYGTEEGLSESKIISITQDSIGFIWLAGENSLTRFDGHHFKTYKNRGPEHTILPANKITSIYTDSDGTLWAASDNGIFYYDFLKDQFIGSFEGWENIYASDLTEIDQGKFIIATNDGLAFFDKHTHQTKWVTGTDRQKTAKTNVLPGNNIKKMAIEPNGEIWLALFPNGLCRLNPKTLEVSTFHLVDQVDFDQLYITNIQFIDNSLFISSLSNGFLQFTPEHQQVKSYIFENQTYDIQHFIKGMDGNLWLATNSGLIKYNFKTKEYQRFTNIPGDPLSLERTAVDFVYLDRDENLWTSSGIRGINYGLNNVPFEHFLLSPDLAYSLTNKEVTSINFDHTGNMWLGYEAGLVEKHSTTTHLKTKYQISSKSLSGYAGAIFSILEDKKHNIWIGGWECGLQKLDPKTNTFNHIELQQESLSKFIKTADIRSLVEDKKGNIWISAQGKGIIKYNPTKNQAQLFQFDENNIENSLSNDYTFSMCLDTKNNLWIATSHGISKLNTETLRFHNYYHNDNKTYSLASNTVHTVYCDKTGLIWAGTNNGLSYYNIDKDNFESVFLTTDFSYQNISSIQSVSPGEIWVSTKSGIFKLNYSWTLEKKLDYQIDFFNHTDGLISANYFDRSSAENSNGYIFFGGNEGVDKFNARGTLHNNNRAPKIIITETSVYGLPVFPAYTNENNSVPVLELNDDQKMVSFRYTSLNFTTPRKQKYRYKLEGFNNQWIIPQNEQVATYTSLKPGTYLFKVQTTNWMEQWDTHTAKILLKVNPPFWMTIPFMICSALLLFALIFFALRLRDLTLIKRQHQLESIIEERTRELQLKNTELAKANLTKNKFLTIISHDLRSPFGGLLGILDLLNGPEKLEQEKQKQFLKVANRSAENIYNLLDNLLTWANSQSEKLSYFPSENNLSTILLSNVELDQERALQKGIKIKKDFPDSLLAFCDPDMINTVVRNILSNAIKFTKPGGEVVVTSEQNKSKIIIHISDTGIGLNQKQRNNLFKIGENKREGTIGEKGTGLGLIICKEFIEQNQGEIWVTANTPKGSIFHISIPVTQPIEI